MHPLLLFCTIHTTSIYMYIYIIVIFNIFHFILYLYLNILYYILFEKFCFFNFYEIFGFLYKICFMFLNSILWGLWWCEVSTEVVINHYINLLRPDYVRVSQSRKSHGYLFEIHLYWILAFVFRDTGNYKLVFKTVLKELRVFLLCLVLDLWYIPKYLNLYRTNSSSAFANCGRNF